jgi:hypothetical protein
MRKLEKEECLSAMAAGEFGEELRKASDSVAIVLTQSWCPQWAWMRGYLESLPADPERKIFWVEYDREDYFEDFMRFKETAFGNDQVPYVRYYRDGDLVSESNYIDQGGFLRRLAGTK